MTATQTLTARNAFLAIALSLAMTLANTNAHSQSRQDEQLANASVVLDELRAIPERAIPPILLDRAYAIAVIPNMLKIGVGVAGRHGNGVLSVRQDDGWSAPVFIKLSGGSIGWQAGLQTSDLVLVFTNERGVQNITRGKVTLGADASIAAGPVGRQASAATDHRFAAEVYSYSRTKGLFAGVSVEGAALRVDKKANAAFYVMPAITADAIIAGQVDSVPDSAVQFGRRLPQAGMTLAAAQSQSDEQIMQLEPAQDVAEIAPAKTFALGERPAESQPTDED
ncbi:MAG: lipid-binding SYLF domain-containing protein [Pseudomonadota bacterium]